MARLCSLDFTRDENGNLTGFVLNGFSERNRRKFAMHCSPSSCLFSNVDNGAKIDMLAGFLQK